MPAAEKVLDFSNCSVFVSTRLEQLLIQSRDQPSVSVPLNEIAVVILCGPEVSITQPALAGLLACKASVVVAGANHLPAGMLLPISGNSLCTQRLFEQIGASRPLCKRLWQQIVQCKIRAQAKALRDLGVPDAAVRGLAGQVRSGDPANLESIAAQRYWQLLFDGFDFQRRYERDDANKLLNYGYAVLRAAIARAICAAGLHPALGVHHRARGNPFCLADDLMEPYRPMVDAEVRRIVGEWGLMPRSRRRSKNASSRRSASGSALTANGAAALSGLTAPLNPWLARSQHDHAMFSIRRPCGVIDPPTSSRYRTMWLYAMFDLPVDTIAAKREYVRFRKLLLRQGFAQLQYSVYARHCASEESGEIIRQTVKLGLPEDGQVRLLSVTDHQFAKQEVFYGKNRRPTEEAPAQFILF